VDAAAVVVEEVVVQAVQARVLWYFRLVRLFRVYFWWLFWVK
jgi:hypothetical protein